MSGAYIMMVRGPKRPAQWPAFSET